MILLYDEEERLYKKLIYNETTNLSDNLWNKGNNQNMINKITKLINIISNPYQLEILPVSIKPNTYINLSEDLKKEIEYIIKKYKNLNINESINTKDKDFI